MQLGLTNAQLRARLHLGFLLLEHYRLGLLICIVVVHLIIEHLQHFVGSLNVLRFCLQLIFLLLEQTAELLLNLCVSFIVCWHLCGVDQLFWCHFASLLASLLASLFRLPRNGSSCSLCRGRQGARCLFCSLGYGKRSLCISLSALLHLFFGFLVSRFFGLL